MRLTIVGCGYVGMALARELRRHHGQAQLTLTTTSEERRGDLEPLADQVLICDARKTDGSTRR